MTIIIRKLSVGNTKIIKKYFLRVQYFGGEKSVPDLTVTSLIFQFSHRQAHGYLQNTSYSNSGLHFPYYEASA